MPEEIVYEWQTPRGLFNHLTLPEAERPDILAYLVELTSHSNHIFRFIDARGTTIQFPLRLVSNTMFSHHSHRSPFDLAVGSNGYTLQVIEDPPSAEPSSR